MLRNIASPHKAPNNHSTGPCLNENKNCLKLFNKGHVYTALFYEIDYIIDFPLES